MASGRIVAIHGFAQTGRCWGSVPGALEASGYEVITPDLPGHGDSTEPPSDLAATAQLLATEHGRATYLGYSFGGRVAQRLALDHPEPVERLVLIGATPGLADPAERAARRAADERLAASIEADGVDVFLDRWLALPLFAGLSTPAQHRAERRRNTAAGLAGSLRRAGTGAQEPLWDRLGELRGPVLLVTGERDERFSAIGDAMAAVLGDRAQRRTIPGAGHSVHLEQPEAFVDVLLAWLDETAAAAARRARA